MPLSAADAIGPAITRTKQQLFSPFRWRRWARLAVVCLLTGDFAGGGAGGHSGGFNYPGPRGRTGRTLLALPHPDWSRLLPWLPWIIAGVALLFLLVLLWIYVASVYRFVLFDSVLYDRCELKGNWQRWEPSGRSYFFWCLGLIAVSLIGCAAILGLPLFFAWRAGLFRHPDQHLAALILAGIALVAAVIIFALVVAVVALFAKDFCIPIMALEQVGVLAAWTRLRPILAMEKLAFTAYVLMKIVLAIGSAILFGIIGVIAFLVTLIPLGVLGVIVFFAGKALGLGLNVGTISILAVLGIVVLSGIFYLMAVVSTPPMVFFQAYALHFLGSRYSTLGNIVAPPEPETLPPSAAGNSVLPGGPLPIEPSSA